ncbi:PREDICTED: pentatricopeptide repeat-containing protein At1g06140, mitochondrial-like [Lupinus angustifolius]|nr:PREDICTED: pentatricopeptide repeat-containing protein At1g06140, mitochondrial-like [Lupinus angustifolius]
MCTSQNPSKTLLSLFSSTNFLSLTKQLHSHLIINGLHKELFYGSHLTNTYIKLGSLPLASKAFNHITTKNLHSWNTIISGYSKHGFYSYVLKLFNKMRSEGNGIDSFNLVYATKACQRLKLLPNGVLIHCLAIKSGFEGDLFVVPVILEMYALLDSLSDARKVFDQYSCRSSVLWGFMIKGYLKFSQESEVFGLFYDMTSCFGFRWDSFTMEGLVRACANVSAGREGKASHGVCVKNNLLVNFCLLTSVIDMYMKCGIIHYAMRLFEEASDSKDVVLWSAVINGCAKTGRFLEAMSVFKRMMENSIMPNPVTFSSVILACSGVGSLMKGKSVHGFVIRNMVELDVVNYTSLLDMYAKCGRVETAYRIFRTMPTKNVVSWTAMINGYAMNGLYSDAISIFDQMTQKSTCVISEKHTPNSITFVSALSACRHRGMVQEGWRIFKSMKDYAISPTEEHYACMVDVLTRAGQYNAALSFISDMPMPIKPGRNVWEALLSACRVHERVEFDEEITKMRMTEEGFNKSLGFASIEVKNKLYVFGSAYTLAFKNTETSHIWNSLSKEMRESALL